ncbi:MAG: class I SAM-dependent methyltransferase [Candidatus Competibacteraceae bacterium]
MSHPYDHRVTDPLASLQRYYRFHARLYDATRWLFLFGRHALVRAIAEQHSARRILEVGCGTGKNLLALSRAFPEAHCVGLDISEAMLTRARKKLEHQSGRITLLNQAYDQPLCGSEAPSFDLVVFSYAWSMMNPGWEQAIVNAVHDLRPGGLLAVVDFNATNHSAFQRWMAFNHVRMEAHLSPRLTANLDTHSSVADSAGLQRLVDGFAVYRGKTRLFSRLTR